MENNWKDTQRRQEEQGAQKEAEAFPFGSDFLSPEDFEAQAQYAGPGAQDWSRRKIRPFARVVLLVAGLLILFLVLNATLFRVRHIQVNGLRTRDPQSVVELSGLNRGMISIFFGVNERDVEKRLSSDWYLSFVSIERRFPDTLILNVKERAPCANVQGQGSLYLIDEEGFVLANTGSISKSNNLPVLTGLQVRSIRVGEVVTPAKQDQFEDYLNVIAELLKQGCVTEIDQINVTNSEHIYLTTVSGYTADLGQARELMAKIGTMRGVVNKLKEMGRIGGMIDVTIPGEAVYSPQ